MKVRIQRQSDKVSPYRLKSGRYTVSVHTEDEAKRFKHFIHKVTKNQVAENYELKKKLSEIQRLILEEKKEGELSE